MRDTLPIGRQVRFATCLMGDFELIDLGAFTTFKRKVQALSNRMEDREFRLRELENSQNPEGSFWVLEEEDADTLFGGILHVQEGRVYAISSDVFDFVNGAFGRMA